MKISWVTIDRFCQDEADGSEDIRRELARNGRPLRSSADSLSDDELLAKLRDLGLDVDRDGVERLCAGALSTEEAARPITDKLELDDMTVDWVWICLLALWERWWPDRPDEARQFGEQARRLRHEPRLPVEPMKRVRRE